MNLSRLVLLLCCFFWGVFTYAETITAPMQSTDWRVEKSKTQCRLQQDVDSFGRIGFLNNSGEPLAFFLQPFDQSSEISKASLFVESAPWHDQVSYQQDYPVFIEGNALVRTRRLVAIGDPAENMLYALLQGHYPVFSFVADNKETRIAASAINFSESYSQFIDCRQALLPFNQRQLGQGSLFFMPQSTVLSSQIVNRLQQVADYLKEMPAIKVTVVNETAKVIKSKDKRFAARAKQVVDRLVRLGVSAERIKIKASINDPANENDILLSVFGPDSLRVFYYRKGNTALNASEQQRLDWLVRYINEFFQSGRLIINSHTDSKGARAKNLATSQERGNVIKAYLEAQGIASDRIEVKAYGESRPAKSNRYPSGRAMNRRVVIDLVQ